KPRSNATDPKTDCWHSSRPYDYDACAISRSSVSSGKPKPLNSARHNPGVGIKLVARRRRGRWRTGGQPVLADDQLSPIEGRTVRLLVRYRAALTEPPTAGDLETDPARMARQSSPGGGRSSSSHGYWVTSPVAKDRRKSTDSGQPQRTPSLPVKAIWPLDHTGGPDGYTNWRMACLSSAAILVGWRLRSTLWIVAP
ncbi:MAG: hypothetical protein RLZZ245_1398, partial [Verrucomicrobiota bacterium]